MRLVRRVAVPLILVAGGALLAAGCAGEAAEGRPWVHDIHIEGNQHLGAGQIVERIQLEPKSWLPFSAKHYYDPSTLEVDRGRIEALYRAHGYFRARVVRAEAKPRGDGSSVDVEIVVDEGLPTR